MSQDKQNQSRNPQYSVEVSYKRSMTHREGGKNFFRLYNNGITNRDYNTLSRKITINVNNFRNK